MSSCAWVVTNLKSEVDLAPSPPVSRLVFELLSEPDATQRPPVVHPTHREPLKPGFSVTLENTALNMPQDRLPVRDGLVQNVWWQTTERVGSTGPARSARLAELAGPKGQKVQVAVEMAFPAQVRQTWEPGVPARLGLELERGAVVGLFAGRKIGLDPGHGGKDTGAVGAAYHESEVVFKINHFLSRWLAAHRSICVLSRDDDVEVSLKTRLRLMHQERPEVYIGLHTGSDTDRRRRGTIVLHRRDQASERLARCLQAAILTRNPFLVDGGIHPVDGGIQPANNVIPPADTVLLSGLRVPAVIVLPEYITHHLGEGLLRAVDFQERVAQSLFDGLTAYFKPSPGAALPGKK